jgi:nucleoside-diphosphate-sugar epimerase
VKRILVTGAGGYLGRGLCESLALSFSLRLMDLRPFDAGEHELVVGDVTDLAAARDATRGVDALVIAHMATRQTGSYDTPVAAFDVNVKGTANLLFAAVENDVRRAVLISSCGVVYGYRGREYCEHDLPPKGIDMYGLTKQCQEVVAEFYHREHGMEIAALRIGGLLYEDTMVDKYGHRDEKAADNAVDPRDVGHAARLALELPALGYETLYVMGARNAARKYDLAYTERLLGFQPAHRYGA